MSELDSYKPVAEAISLLLFPHAEVVIHDLETQCVVAIFNSLSKRKIGDESLLDEMPQPSDAKDVFPPYSKVNWDGRKMKSVSAIVRSKKGKPIGLFCINLDISKWELFHDFIRSFITSDAEKPDLLFKNDWRERINGYVSTYLKNHGLCLESLDRQGKQRLVLALKREGAFATTHAAAYVAEVLQISRATVYNYLKEKA